ncbi:hypothetical protein V1477_016853 [Vespula maculifrons]|uniref:Uncharacterized protein n=1 Tax=Vespula maculifrons TaxID=7453 RepID=A0ABD2B4E0_VESMC
MNIEILTGCPSSKHILDWQSSATCDVIFVGSLINSNDYCISLLFCTSTSEHRNSFRIPFLQASTKT